MSAEHRTSPVLVNRNEAARRIIEAAERTRDEMEAQGLRPSQAFLDGMATAAGLVVTMEGEK